MLILLGGCSGRGESNDGRIRTKGRLKRIRIPVLLLKLSTAFAALPCRRVADQVRAALDSDAVWPSCRLQRVTGSSYGRRYPFCASKFPLIFQPSVSTRATLDAWPPNAFPGLTGNS